LIMYGEYENVTSGLDTYNAVMSASAGTDNYSMSIKIAFTCVNIPFQAFAVLALVALNRTRRTPPTARSEIFLIVLKLYYLSLTFSWLFIIGTICQCLFIALNCMGLFVFYYKCFINAYNIHLVYNVYLLTY